MRSRLNIRGPYPANPFEKGFQDFYVSQGPGEGPRVRLHFSGTILYRADCACTELASLQSPCSHIQAVLNFRDSISSDSTAVGSPSSPSSESFHQSRELTRSSTQAARNEHFAVPTTTSSFAAIAPGVLSAVRDEIAAIQSSTNTRRVHLTRGTLAGSVAGSYKYRFDLEDEFRSPADTPVQLFLDGDIPPVSGTVVRCESDKLVEVAIDKFLGERIARAFLESRLDFIWQRAAKRLEAYQESKTEVGMIATVLRPANESISSDSLDEDWGQDTLSDNTRIRPDAEQRDALQMSLRQRVTFVYGPPGTGKSVTIGWLVKELVRRGERIVVASHTNVAVDNALEKALSTTQGRRIEEEGRIVRLGEPLKQDLEKLRLPNVIAKMSSGLKDELARLEGRQRELARALDTASQEVNILEQCRTLGTDYQSLRQQSQAADDLVMQLDKEVQNARLAVERMHRQALVHSLADLMLWLPRALSKREASMRLVALSSKLNDAKSRSDDLSEQLARAAARIDNMQLPNDASGFEVRLQAATSERERLQNATSQVTQEIQAVKDQLDQVAENVLSNVQVVGATLSKICLESALERASYDTLIIDELSAAPFPLILVALALPRKRAVFFGDPKQLPPISTSDSLSAQFWLKRDTYEILPQHKAVSFALTNQRRMPPCIVDLINERMYRDKPLRTPGDFAAGKAKELDESPFEGAHVVFVDTSHLNPWSARDSSSSRYNLYSAQIVTELIAQEIRRAVNRTIKDIGIICPYRAQKKLIKEIFESRFPARDSDGGFKFEKFVNIHTVDAFQGEQRDVIILDLTAGPPESPGIRLSEDTERFRNPDPVHRTSKVSRLLNVAVTRTKKKLVIVANRDYFDRKLGEHEFVRDLIRRACGKEREYRSIDADDFLRTASSGGEEKPRFLDETSYFAALRADLATSRNSVMIVSPFVSRRRVQDLKPCILDVLRRGVKLEIVTRPVAQMDFGVEALQQLESWGCAVKYRPKTHEKIVFIDNCVAYYGSLNTLSHLDTRETMLRIEGEGVIALLAQFIGFLRPTSKPARHPVSRDGIPDWLTRDQCATKLKSMRYKIGTQRHIPFYAALYNQTIESLLDCPPITEEDLFEALQECHEKQLKHLAPFLEEILSILNRYRPELK